ncbi:hypothetical protein [Alcanivorax jadensis]|uniref:hypothetical protein n=1 Tax=Alcanivorax jadensis TaxID=64988 RepID=UPI0023540730|nr:hypothetical protein [Alcanivorax jadensis]
MSEQIKQTPAETVSDILGGTRELARELKRVGCQVDQSNISRWKGNGGLIPSKYHRPLLELAKLKRRRLTEKHLIHGRVVDA